MKLATPSLLLDMMESRRTQLRSDNECDLVGKIDVDVRPAKKARHNNTSVPPDFPASTAIAAALSGAGASMQHHDILGQSFSSSRYNTSAVQDSIPTYFSAPGINHPSAENVTDAQLRRLSELTKGQSVLPNLQDIALLNMNTYPLSTAGTSLLGNPTLAQALNAQSRQVQEKIMPDDPLKSYMARKTLEDAEGYGNLLSADSIQNALLVERMKLQMLSASHAESGAPSLWQQAYAQQCRQSDILLHQQLGVQSTLEGQVKDDALSSGSKIDSPLYLPRPLSIPEDEERLSTYQCLLRKQIEVFEAKEDDVRNHAKGRSKPVSLGQVGIRCRHCRGSSSPFSQKGSAYFPSTLLGVYQAAQNMALYHINTSDSMCFNMPDKVRNEFDEMLPCKSTVGGGKEYWADAAKSIGLMDTPEGIRFRGVTRGAAKSCM